MDAQKAQKAVEDLATYFVALNEAERLDAEQFATLMNELGL